MKKWLIVLALFLFGIEASSTQPLVIFGAGGDLTKRKLIPALVHLEANGKLADDFVLIGISRRDQKQFFNEISSFIPPEDRSAWKSLSKKIRYISADLEDEKTYEKLSANSIFYLATPPALVPDVIHQLQDHNLLSDSSRLIVEKPFGTNLETALTLNKEISQTLNEEQIFRIDHYLGKESVLNLVDVRKENPWLDRIWNRESIEKVEIDLFEEIGAEGRGVYWEQTGLLRDVVQNHAMQMLALTAMDISQDKLAVFKDIRIDPEVIRGQYEGYRQEKGVAPDSNVETFIKLKLFVDNERWQDVPFIIRAGKKAPEKRAQVTITFKSKTLNQLIFRIHPKEEIVFVVHTSQGTREMNLKIPSQDPYARLLFEAIHDDRTHSVSMQEVEASWRLLEPILQEKSDELVFYPPGSITPFI